MVPFPSTSACSWDQKHKLGKRMVCAELLQEFHQQCPDVWYMFPFKLLWWCVIHSLENTRNCKKKFLFQNRKKNVESNAVLDNCFQFSKWEMWFGNWDIIRKLCINRKTIKHMDIEAEHTASINCLISDSEILVPSFGKPDLNSSRVIVPLLSVSRDLNISFRPIISSSDKFSATTWLKLMKMLEL